MLMIMFYYNYNERKPSRFSAEAVPASIPFLKIYQEHFGVLFLYVKYGAIVLKIKTLPEGVPLAIIEGSILSTRVLLFSTPQF